MVDETTVDTEESDGCEPAASCLAAAEGEQAFPRELPKNGAKRQEYLSWEEYFMAVACLAAQRSKDPDTQVGAVIVNADKRIVGSGYNGMPNGCPDDAMPWGKCEADPLKTKYPFVCHAEMNAILNKNCESVKGSTMYTALFPCNECAKLIIQAGVAEVVYKSEKKDKMSTIAAKRMFDFAGVHYRHFHSDRMVVIDLGISAASIMHGSRCASADSASQSTSR